MRGDDLSLLVRHYLRRYNRELGKDIQGIDPEALALVAASVDRQRVTVKISEALLQT